MSVEFSPTSAVPGEETTLKVKALPDSLCGVSAIDQSVLVKEPGKTLTSEQVIGSTKFNQKGLEAHSDHPEGPPEHTFHFQMFELLPVRKVSGSPYEVEDAVPCLYVRQRRSRIQRPLPDDANDAHSVFEVNSVLFFQPYVIYA